VVAIIFNIAVNYSHARGRLQLDKAVFGKNGAIQGDLTKF